MKLIVCTFAAGLILSSFIQTSFAQNYPGSGPGPAMQQGGGTPQEFSEMKTRILTMIEERKKRIDQEKSCVEASTNFEELKKCRPAPQMGGQGGQFQGGPGQQQFQRGGLGQGAH